MNNLIERIDKLISNKFSSPSDIATLNSWKYDVQEQLIIKDLEKNAGIQKILSLFNGKIVEINDVLITADSATLSNERRDRLLDMKTLYTDFVSLFEGSDKILKSIERKVDENE